MKRRDEMNARCPRVAGGIVLRERANLRTGEAFERPGSRVARERLRAADTGLDLLALARGARVHPDGSELAGKRVCKLMSELTIRSRCRERGRPAFVQVQAAMLLRRSRDRGEPGHRLAILGDEPRQHQIERLDPHQRRSGDDPGIVAADDAVIRSVLWKLGRVVQRDLRDDSAGARVYQCGGQALRTGIEAQVHAHLTVSSPRSRMSFDEAPTMILKTPGSTIQRMFQSSMRSSFGPRVSRDSFCSPGASWIRSKPLSSITGRATEPSTSRM